MAPEGCRSSFVAGSPARTARAAEPARIGVELQSTPNNPYVPSTSETTSAWASGDLLASAGDLARAGNSLFRGGLLSARSRREMTHWVKAIFKPPE